MSLLFKDKKEVECTHEKRKYPISDFRILDRPRQYIRDLNVIFKCMYCGHLFSPKLTDDEIKFVEGNR